MKKKDLINKVELLENKLNSIESQFNLLTTEYVHKGTKEIVDLTIYPQPETLKIGDWIVIQTNGNKGRKVTFRQVDSNNKYSLEKSIKNTPYKKFDKNSAYINNLFDGK